MALICSILSLLWCLLRLVGMDSAAVKNGTRKILNSKLLPVPHFENKITYLIIPFEALDWLVWESLFVLRWLVLGIPSGPLTSSVTLDEYWPKWCLNFFCLYTCFSASLSQSLVSRNTPFLPCSTPTVCHFRQTMCHLAGPGFLIC